MNGLIHRNVLHTILISFLFLVIFKASGLRGLSDYYQNQINSNQENVDKIKSYILTGEGRHQTFNRLAELGDDYGARHSGSKELEDAIDFVLHEMNTTNGFDNVHGESVKIPDWKRIKEFAEIVLQDKRYSMPILGLGSSIGTNGTNLTAEVIVVKTFDELESRSTEVRGKIVVYNQAWNGYGASVAYRSGGAAAAAKHGAVGALVRSVTDLSIYSLHTGQQNYDPTVPKIPVASVTVEDAEYMQRLSDRKIPYIVTMFMETTQTEEGTTSRNVVGEIVGSEFPEQVVIFGGHIDAWDVGTGSMDDGGGVMIAWEALRVIKNLNIKPRRTLRVVLWTSEEQGLLGGEAYYEAHKNESEDVSIIMESDHGVFRPRGLAFTGSNTAKEILQSTLDTFLNDINTTTIVDGGSGSDTGWWVSEKNVPGVELYSYNEKYFHWHHSEGDTMSVLNADDLDKATTLWATTILVVGNLNEILPRNDDNVSSAAATLDMFICCVVLQQLFVVLLFRRC